MLFIKMLKKNTNKKQKVLTLFDDMIADMLCLVIKTYSDTN